MSIRIMTEVWENSSHTGNHLLMLLAIADQCNDEGFCYPGVKRLAKKTRLSVRHAQRILHELTDSNEPELIIHLNTGIDANGGSTNLYELALVTNGDLKTRMLKEEAEVYLYVPPTNKRAWPRVMGGGDTDVMGGGDTDVTQSVSKELDQPLEVTVTTSPFFIPDSLPNQNQDRPTGSQGRPAKKTPNSSSAPTAISNRSTKTASGPTLTPQVITSDEPHESPMYTVDTPDWLPSTVTMPDLPTPTKRDGIPPHWGPLHLAILLYWLGVKSRKPYNTEIAKVEGIATALVDKTHLPALTPLVVADFRQWYYEQGSIIELARKNNPLAEHPSEVISMPDKPEKVAKWIDLYVAERQTVSEDFKVRMDYAIKLRDSRNMPPPPFPGGPMYGQGKRTNQEGAGHD